MALAKSIAAQLKQWFPAQSVSAHCDGPCGVYDPASARIAAEAVVSMTKKILDLDPATTADYENTVSRYIAIKEEQAQITKDELLILWTDYFKPEHLEQYPQLHEKFWKAAKLCSACKVNVDLDKTLELMKSIKDVQEIFWATKGRNDVSWYVASPVAAV
ncbi:superoxide dismutase, Ni [Rubidibacter lacunae KORDI 51-2]|uniref:Superoxide dismutase, Ni n=1 Tax=Rubidibacter lacunae KORDI 51-2 TaxID=582515 RepID=U5DMA2_9CHRO|nr:superoxide dismutase, Ni [Rubidibacter lacunae]ERN42002.1 superoxide dismutase, Ni [Rubidibacter lacunae KORDI 51-2]